MESSRYLAFDLGGSHGRAFVGTIANGKLELEEIYRFPNEPVELSGTLHWDILALYNHVLKGMREYVKRFGTEVDGIGIDTWALDYGLLTEDGQLLQNPVQYRDHRTDGMVKKLDELMPLQEVFEITGMGPSDILTSCQLLSMKLQKSPILGIASTLLSVSNLLSYFLTGVKACERTFAITTQLYEPRSGQWSEKLIGRLNLPASIFPKLVDPGTVLGGLTDKVKMQTGLQRGTVIAPCTHDTPSAVSAVPGEGDDWAFISSGTWSTLGALTDEIVTSPQALNLELANELTLGSFFICKNITGLFILQQARAIWADAGDKCDFAELTELAEHAPAGGPIIDPLHADFISPQNMMEAITDFCLHTGQQPPEGVAATTRCILESLALCYRLVLEQLTSVMNRKFNVINVVGGGSKNTLLCRLTADAAGLPVVAGPDEATVAGNILTQAFAMGELASADQVREVVRKSSQLQTYQPRDSEQWNERYAAYCRIHERA